MNKKIFISYARPDYPFAHRLVEHLKQYGTSGWMDAADISAGGAIASTIRSALKESSAVVVLVSPDSLRSHWINFELGASAALNIPIIPIVIGGEGVENDLPEPLRGVQFIDARNRPIDAIAEEVEKALRRLDTITCPQSAP